MKIAIFHPKVDSAIERLIRPIVKHNPQFQIEVAQIHPKRNDADQLFRAHDLLKWADIIDIHYWKSGEILKASFPIEFAAKPKVLCHFNPYDLKNQDWQKEYDITVVGNNQMQSVLPWARLVPYCVDLDFFEFNEDYTENKTVNMVVNRIEGKKGVLEVAKACAELKYEFNLVGNVSEGEYMRQVMAAGGDYIHFFENATDEALKEIYYKSAIHVCNSVDAFESGTMPILEAMACGVPVLTRNVGHVPDIYDGGNMIVRPGKDDDVEDLKKQLQNLMDNPDLRKNLRESGWKTIKNRNDVRMARKFSRIYYDLWEKRTGKPLVSLIMPTFDRGEGILEPLAAAVTQTWDNLELIIVDSGNHKIDKLVDKLREQAPTVAIKYIKFQHNGEYTLAKARNLGILESQGEILVFCDDRLKMNQDAVEQFAGQTDSKTWLWGVKDETVKPFIENFSSIRRDDLITAGMFNERVDHYGAMSEEIRSRFTRQGFLFELVETAQATSSIRARSRASRRKDIVEAKLIMAKLYGE